MDDVTARAITNEFDRIHGSAFDHSGPVHAELARALDMLPDAGIWAIAQPCPAIFARSDRTLFIIALRDQHLVVTSRTIDGEKLGVALKWGEPISEIGGVCVPTEWIFRYDAAGDEDAIWTTIKGALRRSVDGTLQPDRLELFARDLAASAGWALAEIAEPLVRVA
jgi:hypothetical protein